MTELSDNLPPGLRGPVVWMLKVKTVLIAISSLIMAATFLLVVILRYILETDLFAYEEWLLVICFWLYFLGGAMGSYENSHVKADLITHIMKSGRAKWTLGLLVTGIEIVVCLVLIYWSILMIMEEIDAYPFWQTTIALQIPFIAPRLAVLVGFALMGFYSALHFYVMVRHGPDHDGDSNVLDAPGRSE